MGGPRPLRWRPHAHAGMTHTATEGPDRLMVEQSDHAGVIGFATEERIMGLPQAEYRLGLGMTVQGRTEGWRVRLDHAGTSADGESDHAVQARLQMRF